MSNSIRIECLLDIFLAGLKLTRFFIYFFFTLPPPGLLIDFAENVSDEKIELQRAGFYSMISNRKQQNTCPCIQVIS